SWTISSEVTISRFSLRGCRQVAKVTFKSNAAEVEKLIMSQISANMQAVQAEYAKDMHDTLTNDPQGRYWKNAGTPYFYEVEGPGPGVHRASKPGDPP